MQQSVQSKKIQHLKDKTSIVDGVGSGFDVVSFSVIGVMGIVSAFIGVGAVICFVSALLNSGPFELIKGFAAAVTAM